MFCGADPDYALPYRFVGEYATHAFFCNIMFPKNVRGDADREAERWTLLNVPSFHCRSRARRHRSASAPSSSTSATGSPWCSGRADYCGVNKKTMFTVMNYVLPKDGLLPMHCSANVGADGDSAILFGLSGTGQDHALGRSAPPC